MFKNFLVRVVNVPLSVWVFVFESNSISVCIFLVRCSSMNFDLCMRNVGV